jgi:hypothetical protein
MTTTEHVTEIQTKAAEAHRLTEEVLALVAQLPHTDDIVPIQQPLRSLYFSHYAKLLKDWVDKLPLPHDFPKIPTPLATLPLAHGTLTVVGGKEPDYPGYAIEINGQTAAVVEWHPEYQTFVLRTYTATDEEPHTYHTWDGRRLGP